MTSERAKKYLAYLAALSATAGLGQIAAPVSATASPATATTVSSQAQLALAQSAAQLSDSSHEGVRKSSWLEEWGQFWGESWGTSGAEQRAPQGESFAAILKRV